MIEAHEKGEGKLAKYQFKLQNLLDVKMKIEDQKKNDYSKALQKVELEKQIKRKLDEDHVQAIHLYKEKIQVGFAPIEVQQYNQYLAYLKKKQQAQSQILIQTEEYAERKRNELLDSMKQRKTLEVLKEKDYDAFRQEEQRMDQQLIDELVSFRYAKRSS